MPVIDITIQPIARNDVNRIEFIDDLEVIVESEKCSCNAGDDVPF
ncbi:hypothetical protein [Streptomyces sp. 4F14]